MLTGTFSSSAIIDQGTVTSIWTHPPLYPLTEAEALDLLDVILRRTVEFSLLQMYPPWPKTRIAYAVQLTRLVALDQSAFLAHIAILVRFTQRIPPADAKEMLFRQEMIAAFDKLYDYTLKNVDEFITLNSSPLDSAEGRPVLSAQLSPSAHASMPRLPLTATVTAVQPPPPDCRPTEEKRDHTSLIPEVCPPSSVPFTAAQSGYKRKLPYSSDQTTSWVTATAPLAAQGSASANHTLISSLSSDDPSISLESSQNSLHPSSRSKIDSTEVQRVESSTDSDAAPCLGQAAAVSTGGTDYERLWERCVELLGGNAASASTEDRRAEISQKQRRGTATGEPMEQNCRICEMRCAKELRSSESGSSAVETGCSTAALAALMDRMAELEKRVAELQRQVSPADIDSAATGKRAAGESDSSPPATRQKH